MDDSVIGTEVDGYRIEEMLGRGGMGVVYRAEDVALSRDVALKRINPSLANDEAFLRRFRSEAQALARVDSPYIVSVHALRQTDVGLLIVMEYVEGGTVTDLIDEGPMAWEEARPIVTQMLKALEHAHGAEVIHRDIKPQNIMLSATGTVKVTYFGLSKVHRPDSNKTVTQGVFGTLNYMSPEQVKASADLDHRSDLYSLGMTIYEMLAGDLPFDEDSSEFTQMRVIVEEELPRPDELHAEVPDGLSELVMKALEKDPDDRFQSAEAMREAFEAYDEHRRAESVAAPPSSEPAAKESTDDPEESATVSSSGWQGGALLAALVLLVAGGGLWLFAAQGLFGGGGGTGPPTTQLSVTTEPTGATVFVNDEEIGTTPLSGATIEGSTAAVRVQKAGFVTRDTTIAQLDGTQQLALDVPLLREEESFTLRSDPAGAQVTVDGEDLGSTPTRYTTRKGTLQIQMRHEGYVPGETRLAVAQLDQDEFEMQLEPRSQPDPPTDDNGDDASENNTATTTEDDTRYGALTLGASPTSSVTAAVDGESRPVGQSIQVPIGRHTVRISHPEYGRCDTTLTVEAEEEQTHTCYFEHQVVVRAEPSWAQVFIDGENTEESTEHITDLNTGRTYDIRARRLTGPTVIGGRYLKVDAESNTPISEEEFQGDTRSLTLRPSFEPQRHILVFNTESESP